MNTNCKSYSMSLSFETICFGLKIRYNNFIYYACILVFLGTIVEPQKGDVGSQEHESAGPSRAAAGSSAHGHDEVKFEDPDEEEDWGIQCLREKLALKEAEDMRKLAEKMEVKREAEKREAEKKRQAEIELEAQKKREAEEKYELAMKHWARCEAEGAKDDDEFEEYYEQCVKFADHGNGGDGGYEFGN